MSLQTGNGVHNCCEIFDAFISKHYTREFKNLRLLLKRKHYFIVLRSGLSILWFFHVRSSHRSREWKIFRCVSRCRPNLKNDLNIGRLRQKTPKSVQHDYFFSFNQTRFWFVVLSLSLSSWCLRLPTLGKQDATSTYRPFPITDIRVI